MKMFLKTLLALSVLACILLGSFFYFTYKVLNPEWSNQAELRGPDGYTYRFMRYSVLQAQIMKLVRQKGEIIEELGSNNGDSPRSWASIIRPAGTLMDDYGQLYISSNNTIIGIPYGNHCYFAYEIEGGVFYGHGNIEEISPFLLVEKDTQLHEPDVLALIYEVAHSSVDIGQVGYYLPGCPRPDVLKKGLEHSNDEVKKLSKWLLEIQGHGLSYRSETMNELIDYLKENFNNTNHKDYREPIRETLKYLGVDLPEKGGVYESVD